MKTSTKYLFLLLGILVVAVLALGCTTKATGGGWFLDENTEDQCSFGFNAQIKDPEEIGIDEKEIKGQFQFVDHTSGVKFHTEVNFMDDYPGELDWCAHFGNVDMDGNLVVEIIACDGGDPYTVGSGDYIEIYNYETGDAWYGYLEGGNINAHVEE